MPRHGGHGGQGGAERGTSGLAGEYGSTGESGSWKYGNSTRAIDPFQMGGMEEVVETRLAVARVAIVEKIVEALNGAVTVLPKAS